MGISPWRGPVPLHTTWNTAPYWNCDNLLTSLLVIGGVELNPGPQSTPRNTNGETGSESTNNEVETSFIVEIPIDDGGTRFEKSAVRDLRSASGVTEKHPARGETGPETESPIAGTGEMNVQTLKSKTSKRGKMLQNRKTEIRDLRERNNELARKLQEKETEIYRLTTEKTELLKELETRETEAQRLRSENSAVELELQDKETEIFHLKDVRNLLDLEMRSKDEETLFISDGNKKLETEMQTKERDTKRVREENRLLSRKLREMEEEFRGLANKNKEIVVLLNETGHEKSPRRKTEGKLKDTTDGISEVGGKSDEDRGTGEGGRELIYDKTVLTLAIEEGESEIKALTEENSRLRHELHEKRTEEERLRDENRRLGRAFEENEPRLEILKVENERLRQTFEETEKNVERFTEENTKYEKGLEDIEEELRRLAKDRTRLQSDLHEKRSEAGNISDENARLETALRVSKSELTIEQTRNELRRKELHTEQLKDANAQVANLPRETETRTERMEGENSRLASELREKQSETENMAEQNEFLAEELKNKESEVRVFEQENLRLTNELREKETVTKRLAEENTRLCKELRDKEPEISRFTEESECLSKEIREKGQEIERLRERNSRLANELREKESECVRVTEENIRYDKILQEKEREIEGVAEEIVRNERKLEILAEKRVQVERQLEEDDLRVEEATDRIGSLREKLQYSDSTIECLREENSRLNDELKLKEEEEGCLKEEQTRLKRELEERELKTRNLKDDNSALVRNEQDSSAAIKHLTEENCGLRKQLQDDQRNIERLEQESGRLEAELQERMRNTLSLAEEISEKGKGLVEKKSALQHVMEENGNIDKELLELEQGIRKCRDENKRLSEVTQNEKAEILRLREENLQLEKELRGTRNQKDELGEKFRETEMNIFSLGEDNARVERMLKQKRAELKHQTDESERLLKERESETIRMKQEITQNEERVQGKTAGVEGLVSYFNVTVNQIQDLERQIKTQEVANRNLEDQLQENKIILENLEGQKTELEKILLIKEDEKNNVTDEATDLETNLRSREEIIKGLRRSCEVFKAEIEAKDKDIQSLSERTRKLKEDAQVRETIFMQLTKESSELGRNVQERDSDTQRLMGHNAKLKEILLIKGRESDHLTEANTKLRATVLETQKEFREQLMRRVKALQSPSYEYTAFGVSLRTKVSELMKTADKKTVIEEELFAKETELEKFINDNKSFIRGTEPSAEKDMEFYGDPQNNRREGDLKTEPSVSQTDNPEGQRCLTRVTRGTDFTDANTETDKVQTEIQSSTDKNSASGNESYTNSRAMLSPETDESTLGGETPGTGASVQNTVGASSYFNKGAESKDLLRDETHEVFWKQARREDAENRRRTRGVQRHYSVDTAFDSIRGKTQMAGEMKLPHRTFERSKLQRQLSVSRLDLASLTNGSEGRSVLTNMPLVVSCYNRQSPAVSPQTTEDTYMKKTGWVDTNMQFKINVAALLSIRAMNTRQKFQMASQAHAPQLFNDIILKVGEQTLFLQMNYCSHFNKNTEISQFLQLKGDFSLLKYCMSLCEMKKQWSQNKYLQSQGRFEDSIFIVYTNAEMSHDNGRNEGNTVWQKLLYSGGNCFSFTENKSPDIYEMFQNLERYKQLLAGSRYNSNLTTQEELLDFIRKVWNSNAKTIPGIIEMNKLLKELQQLGDLSHYREFLARLWFFTGQATDRKLDEQTKQEIGLACGITKTNLIYDRFMKQIHDWCKYSNRFLTQESPLWTDIKRDFKLPN